MFASFVNIKGIDSSVTALYFTPSILTCPGMNSTLQEQHLQEYTFTARNGMLSYLSLLAAFSLFAVCFDTLYWEFLCISL